MSKQTPETQLRKTMIDAMAEIMRRHHKFSPALFRRMNAAVIRSENAKATQPQGE